MQSSFRKYNLKLAIFLSYREPSEGGGFTITDDLLNSIISKYKNIPKNTIYEMPNIIFNFFIVCIL